MSAAHACAYGTPSRRLAYGLWHVEYARYPHFLRASRALAVIRGWTGVHIPPVAASLLPGATEAEVDELMAALALPSVHPAVRVVWRLCAGQRLRYDEQLAEPGIGAAPCASLPVVSRC